MSKIKSIQILLGFDFGMKKIGVAVGQSVTHSATPLDKLPAVDGIPDWEKIDILVKTWSADAFVVGLPLDKHGNYQAITYAAKKFANRLSHRFQRAVYLIDERLTTVEAKNTLGNHSEQVDSYAAKLMIETWFRECSKYD